MVGASKLWRLTKTRTDHARPATTNFQWRVRGHGLPINVLKADKKGFGGVAPKFRWGVPKVGGEMGF